jgi:hypothetical protein
VLASAQEAGMLSETDVGQLMNFYADPRRHRWHSGPASDPALSGAIQMQYAPQFLIGRSVLQHLLQMVSTPVANRGNTYYKSQARTS